METERSLSHKDPVVGIKWPLEPTLITQMDGKCPFARGCGIHVCLCFQRMNQH